MDIEGYHRRIRRPVIKKPKSYRKSRYAKRRYANYAVLKNEPKNYLFDKNVTAMDTADVNVIPDWDIPVGDQADKRNGNRIFVRSVTVQLAVTLESANTMRVIIYKNKNGTLSPTSALFTSFGALNYAKDWQGFSVIKDMMLDLGEQYFDNNTRRRVYIVHVPVNQYWNYKNDDPLSPINAPGCPIIRATASHSGANALGVSMRLNFTD